jgi:hypothetical protein
MIIEKLYYISGIIFEMVFDVLFSIEYSIINNFFGSDPDYRLGK